MIKFRGTSGKRSQKIYIHIPLCKGLYVLKDRTRYSIEWKKKERDGWKGRSYYFRIFYYTLIYCSVETQRYTIGLNKKVLSGFDVVLVVVHVKHVVKEIGV